MKQKSGPGKALADQVLKDIRRQTRWQAISLLSRSTSAGLRPSSLVRPELFLQ